MKIEKRNRNRKGREAIREGKGRRVERELWKGMPKERGNSILDKERGVNEEKGKGSERKDWRVNRRH